MQDVAFTIAVKNVGRGDGDNRASRVKVRPVARLLRSPVGCFDHVKESLLILTGQDDGSDHDYVCGWSGNRVVRSRTSPVRES